MRWEVDRWSGWWCGDVGTVDDARLCVHAEERRAWWKRRVFVPHLQATYRDCGVVLQLFVTPLRLVRRTSVEALLQTPKKQVSFTNGVEMRR